MNALTVELQIKLISAQFYFSFFFFYFLLFYNFCVAVIEKRSLTSAININLLTRELLAIEAKLSFVLIVDKIK